ncbi:MAG TPA: hypothetical protein VHJ82_07455 [Actinomycetota bacterium]|jgi:hypothetical protein|nr:hypothetical protein [Actinomycetota bacterium]
MALENPPGEVNIVVSYHGKTLIEKSVSTEDEGSLSTAIKAVIDQVLRENRSGSLVGLKVEVVEPETASRPSEPPM